MSQGPLSRRVRYLKREEGGLNEMCEYSQRIYNGGKEEGRREGKSEGQSVMKNAMILSMKESGIDEAMIEKILKNVQNNKELQQA